jgi:hypothetical protein
MHKFPTCLLKEPKKCSFSELAKRMQTTQRLEVRCVRPHQSHRHPYRCIWQCLLRLKVWSARLPRLAHHQA